MFVQARDRKLYKNPTIHGEGFIIKVTESDPPFIAFRKGRMKTWKAIRGKIHTICRELKLKTKIISEPEIENMALPLKGDCIEEAYKCDIEICSQIPEPTLNEGIIESPQLHSSYLVWELGIPICVIEAAQKAEWNSILLKFLSEGYEGKYSPESIARMRLSKQFPNIFRINDLRSTYGEVLWVKKPN